MSSKKRKRQQPQHQDESYSDPSDVDVVQWLPQQQKQRLQSQKRQKQQRQFSESQKRQKQQRQFSESQKRQKQRMQQQRQRSRSQKRQKQRIQQQRRRSQKRQKQQKQQKDELMDFKKDIDELRFLIFEFGSQRSYPPTKKIIWENLEKGDIEVDADLLRDALDFLKKLPRGIYPDGIVGQSLELNQKASDYWDSFWTMVSSLPRNSPESQKIRKMKLKILSSISELHEIVREVVYRLELEKIEKEERENLQNVRAAYQHFRTIWQEKNRETEDQKRKCRKILFEDGGATTKMEVKRLATKFHPDKFPNATEQKKKQVQYQFLKYMLCLDVLKDEIEKFPKR